MNVGQVDHGGRINQQVRAATDFLRTFATPTGSEQDLVSDRDSYRVQKDEIVMSVGSNICQGSGLKWNKHQAYPLVTSTLGSMKDEYIIFMLYNVHTPIYLTYNHITPLMEAIASCDENHQDKRMGMMKMLPNMRPIGILVGDAEASGEVGDTVCTAQVGGTRSTLATGPWEINCNDLVSVYIQGWEETLYDEHGRSHGLLERFWECFRVNNDNTGHFLRGNCPTTVGVHIYKYLPAGEDKASLHIQKWNDDGAGGLPVTDPETPEPRPFCPKKFALYCMNKNSGASDEEKALFGLLINVPAENQLSEHTKLLKHFHDHGRLGMPSRHHPHQRNKKHLFGIKPYHEKNVWEPSFGDRNRIIGRAISSSKSYTQCDILISRSLL